MTQLQRLVSAYLDLAEDMALRQIPMTMQDWETRLNRFIEMTDRDTLQDAAIRWKLMNLNMLAQKNAPKYQTVVDSLQQVFAQTASGNLVG